MNLFRLMIVWQEDGVMVGLDGEDINEKIQALVVASHHKFDEENVTDTHQFQNLETQSA